MYYLVVFTSLVGSNCRAESLPRRCRVAAETLPSRLVQSQSLPSRCTVAGHRNRATTSPHVIRRRPSDYLIISALKLDEGTTGSTLAMQTSPCICRGSQTVRPGHCCPWKRPNWTSSSWKPRRATKMCAQTVISRRDVVSMSQTVMSYGNGLKCHTVMVMA